MNNMTDIRQGKEGRNGGAKSFSRAVKDEIFRAGEYDMCCVKAEFLGLLIFGAQVVQKDKIKISTDNSSVLGAFVSIARSLGMEAVVHQSSERNVKYTAVFNDTVKVAQILYDLSLFNETGDISYRLSEHILKKICCKRAFLRGAFLGAGTISDPNKNYNLEFVTPGGKLCDDMNVLLASLGFEFKKIIRRNKCVMYVKNSDQIADLLSFLGAYKSQMELLNIKIEKEIRNNFNRTANGETSNINKTIIASVEQIQAIQKVDKLIGLDNLPDDLREIAFLRLKYKDLSLSELGELLNPPLTKSGVNHRMRKIMNYAN